MIKNYVIFNFVYKNVVRQKRLIEIMNKDRDKSTKMI